MTNSKEKYYSVPYKRTSDWWTGDGQWYKLATWCNECFHDWDYVNERFVFTNEHDKALFILKWL